MTSTMKAAVLLGPDRIEVRDLPIPEPGPDEVLVQVRAAGICGTDLALLSGAYPTHYPIVPGHEFCGKVVGRGAAVGEEWADAAVTSEINVTCMSRGDVEPCVACRRQMYTQCVRRGALGIRNVDGAFAEYVRVPVACARRLPAELAPWAGALVEPVAAALQTFELTPLAPRDLVVVLGPGRLGLLVVRIAGSFGARVVAVGRSERSRSLARIFGAEAVYGAEGEEAEAAVRERTEGLGADVVVECTGSPDGLARAVRLVRARGTVALKSTCGAVPSPVDGTDVVVREIRIQGSRCGPFDKAIARLKSGQIPVDDYVSGFYPLVDIRDALEASTRAAKILVEPRAGGSPAP